MELKLQRIARRPLYTIGRLYVDGTQIGNTIEDTDRGLTQQTPLDEIKRIKVPHQTAIPAGRYEITLNVFSPSFGTRPYYKKFCKGYLPRLLNVPGFDGILIHRGVNQDSTSGCIIVGINSVVGALTQSQLIFERLYSHLRTAHAKGEKIFITIT